MERYEIFIIDKGQKKKTNVAGEDEKKKSNVAGEDDAKDEKKEAKSNKQLAKVIAKTTANEVRGLIVPHIGEVARDSLMQQRIDEALNIVDTSFAFAVHPVYGTISFATKVASKLMNYTIKNEKEQNRLSVQMRRASYINRSRD